MLALAIIAALALWRFTPPPRSLTGAGSELVQTIATEGLSARLQVRPDVAGAVTVTLSDLRRSAEAISPSEVDVEFAKPAFGLGPFRHAAHLSDSGDWQAGTYVLPMDGFWLVRVKVLVSDFETMEILDVISINPAAKGSQCRIGKNDLP